MRSLRMAIRDWVQAFVAAIQFLTRIPLPYTFTYTDDHFRRSVIFYPFAGLLIGVIVSIAGSLLDSVFPVFICGIILVALWTSLSGALHLDGLMDLADGLLSHRSRERMLEIMKDSRVGAMGVIVCVFYVLLKTALVISLLEDRNLEWLLLLQLIPVWSRSFMVTAIAGWPYARKGQGLGALYRSVGWKHAFISGIGAAIISTAIIFPLGSWSTAEAGIVLLSMALVTYGIGAGVASAVSRKLGGLTGDVYGALNECIELGLLAALAGYAYNLG
ncbi:adenosylcobinamide-GDP ribazoletransferase [Cohnella sp.]|uniref:adenosylcobinamide-GDP ribazoletransferase n=1 Tax=Cohnella sp. TaxID=1883426 RepID=UPI003566831F